METSGLHTAADKTRVHVAQVSETALSCLFARPSATLKRFPHSSLLQNQPSLRWFPLYRSAGGFGGVWAQSAGKRVVMRLDRKNKQPVPLSEE